MWAGRLGTAFAVEAGVSDFASHQASAMVRDDKPDGLRVIGISTAPSAQPGYQLDNFHEVVVQQQIYAVGKPLRGVVSGLHGSCCWWGSRGWHPPAETLRRSSGSITTTC